MGRRTTGIVGGIALALAAGCGRAAPLAGLSGDGFPTDGGAAPDRAAQPDADAGLPADRDEGSGPPYPIVLAHGFSGWSQIGPLDYFYEVPGLLQEDGHDVHVAEVSPYADSFTRGAQLLAFVRQVLAQTGAAKVDIVAHSQGGLDARFVANALPDQVAVVVTIATPHRGTAVADAAVSGLGGVNGPAASVLDFLFGSQNPGGGTSPPGLLAAMEQMTAAGAAAFDRKVTNGPGVAYFSIAGRSSDAAGGGPCQADVAEPGFIARWDPFVDPISPELAAGAAILAGNPLDPTPNDGLVAVPSARWGTFLGCIPADHLEEIGQILGQSPGPGNPFDWRDFYRGLANWIVAQGF